MNQIFLKFAKSTPTLPDPARARPPITAEDRERAATVPPHAVPFHCKPWVDGQTLGWTLFYGFITPITITAGADGKLEVENIDQLRRETNQPKIVDQFARDHFGIGSGYTLRTPPGVSTLILPGTQPPAGLHALTAVVETDWYPRRLFLVFRVPPPGVRINLDHNVELARVLPVPAHDRLALAPLSADEQAELDAARAAYLEEEARTSSRWYAAGGDSFTHLYKQWSRWQAAADDGADN